MDERLKFVARFLEGDLPMTKLCAQFGISRDVGYKWVRRYRKMGIDGLKDRSRAPNTHPNATSPGMVDLVVATRRDHPTWGPRKVRAWLMERHPALALPAASTIGEVFKRHDLVTPRKRSRRARPEPGPLVLDDRSNACWATDFKGEFLTRDRRYCYPLTIQDRFSRYLLECRGLAKPLTALTKPVFETVFREYGLPDAIRSDNGTPFAVASFAGLTQLSAWWVRLGIRIERIEPGHPEQNGRLERFHRTLKDETTRPPGANLLAQQVQFDRFRGEYNKQRPHEALAYATPASAYAASTRNFPKSIPKPEYHGAALVRRLDARGKLWLKPFHIPISHVLAGEDLALGEIEDGVWDLHFYGLRLGVFDQHCGELRNGAGFSRRVEPRW